MAAKLLYIFNSKDIRKTILTIIFCIILFFLLDRVLFKLLVYQLDDIEGYYTIKNSLKNPLNKDILGIGSSHLDAGIDPRIFFSETNLKFLNAAGNARGYLNNLYILMELLDRKEIPKLIILDINWMSFDKDFLSDRLSPADFYYLSFYNKLHYLLYYPFLSNTLITDAFINMKSLSKLYSYRHYSIFHISKKEVVKQRELLGNKSEIRLNTDSLTQAKIKKGINRFHKEFPDSTFQFDSLKYNSLKKILDIARKKNIKVVLIEIPEYIEWQQMEKRDQFLEYLNPLIKEYDIEYINFNTEEYGIINRKDCFFDIDHLNEKGAKAFTIQLCNELKKRKLLPVKTSQYK